MGDIKNRVASFVPREVNDGRTTAERLAFAPAMDLKQLVAAKHVAGPAGIRLTSVPRVLSAPERGGWMHAWRDEESWRIVRPDYPLRRSRAVTRRPTRQVAPRSAETESGSVPGLLVIPIPTPRYELVTLVKAYGPLLGEMGGERLLWRTLDDPQLHDALYAEQRTPSLKRADRASVKEYLQCGCVQWVREHRVTSEYLLAMQEFDIPRQYPPLILFAALAPVDMLAVLRLNVGMFADPVREKALADHLLTDLSEKNLLRFASDGHFTRDSMRKLQLYLDAVAGKIGQSTECQQPSPPGQDGGASVAVVEREGATPGAYTFVLGSGRNREAVTRDEYRSLSRQFRHFDFVFDGVTRRCHKRARRGDPHQRRQLTLGQFELLQACIVCQGFYKPVKRGDPEGVDYALSAIRQFNNARLRADIAKDGAKFTMFHTRRGRTADQRRFEFDPPKGVSWLLVGMVDP